MSVFGGGVSCTECEYETNKSRKPQSGSREICLFRTTIHSSMNLEKKTIIYHIYNVSKKIPFLDSPRKVVYIQMSRSKEQLASFVVNHRASDLPNCRTT